jgi:hypothetical protein
MDVRRRFFFASLIRMTYSIGVLENGRKEERRRGKEKGRISTNFNFTNSLIQPLSPIQDSPGSG